MSKKTNKGICMIAYLGLFFLVAMLSDRTNVDYRFHANQGFILFMFGLIIIIPLAFINSLFFDLGRLLMLCLSAYGAYYAYKGEKRRLPIIGNLNIIK